MRGAVLDTAGLYEALDMARAHLGLTWRGLAAEVGTSPSTFTRIHNGKSLDGTTLLRILLWLDLDIAFFVKGTGHETA